MTRKIYGYPKCSTCVKAQKFMKDHALSYEIFDITVMPPSKAELTGMLQKYDGQIKKLFNTSGVQYREMGLSKKIDGMSDKELLDLLSKNGKLVKRPFLIVKGQPTHVGFKEDEWKKTLLKSK
jgi:arsenate reductase (glutaredoxin)